MQAALPTSAWIYAERRTGTVEASVCAGHFHRGFVESFWRCRGPCGQVLRRCLYWCLMPSRSGRGRIKESGTVVGIGLFFAFCFCCRNTCTLSLELWAACALVLYKIWGKGSLQYVRRSVCCGRDLWVWRCSGAAVCAESVWRVVRGCSQSCGWKVVPEAVPGASVKKIGEIGFGEKACGGAAAGCAVVFSGLQCGAGAQL